MTVSEAPARTQKTSRYQGPMHVVKLRLKANPRESQILFERMRVVQKMKNDVKGLLVKRVNGMRNGPRFKLASRLPKRTKAEVGLRQQAFASLRVDYLLTDKDVSRLGEQVLKQRGWMRDILTVQIANKAGLEVWREVEQWLYGKRGRPRFRRSDESTSVWGNQVGEGIRVNAGCVIWNSLSPSKRKSLRVKIDYSSLSGPRRAYFDSLEALRYGLSRERVRGQWAYFLLVCLKGEPYRNADYLSSIPGSRLVAVDPGVSYMAVVSEDKGEVVRLISERELRKEQSRARHERRLKRRINRSRRAMNPDAYDEKGHSLKGQRQRELGRDARRLQESLREDERIAAIKRRQRAHAAVHAIASRGAHVVIEQNSFKGFQHTWGKRMGLTAPAQFLSILAAEATRVGGSVVMLSAFTHCLSQYCLCGARRKKDRSETVHHCLECGLGPLDRNLFSAYLARLLVEHDLHEQPQVLRGAPFGADGYREEAVRLCAATPGPAASYDSQASGGEDSVLKARMLAGDQEAQTPREYQAARALAPLLDTSRQAGPYLTPP